MPNEHQPSFISPQVSAESLWSDKPLKLGVMASGSGSNYEAIAQAIADKTLNAQIQVLIYNNPKAKVTERAQRWHTPTVLLNHRDYPTREILDQEIVKVLRNHDVEWVIMAGWMRIITNVLLDAYPNRVLNIHPSLLPNFKGIRGIEQALEAKVKITGCSVHIAHLDVDSGPIIMQAAVPILPNDTPETLHARVQIQEHKIFPLAIALAAQLEHNKD